MSVRILNSSKIPELEIHSIYLREGNIGAIYRPRDQAPDARRALEIEGGLRVLNDAWQTQRTPLLPLPFNSHSKAKEGVERLKAASDEPKSDLIYGTPEAMRLFLAEQVWRMREDRNLTLEQYIKLKDDEAREALSVLALKRRALKESLANCEDREHQRAKELKDAREIHRGLVQCAFFEILDNPKTFGLPEQDISRVCEEFSLHNKLHKCYSKSTAASGGERSNEEFTSCDLLLHYPPKDIVIVEVKSFNRPSAEYQLKRQAYFFWHNFRVMPRMFFAHEKLTGGLSWNEIFPSRRWI